MGDGYGRYPLDWVGRTLKERIVQRSIGVLLNSPLKAQVMALSDTEKDELAKEWEAAVREELETVGKGS